MSVDRRTPAVHEMEDDRALPRALMGGTKAMRASGKTYLPQEPAETDEAYKVRLKRSFLFNGFGKTVSDMAGKVFAKELAFGDDMDPTLVGIGENIDLAGQNLTVFAKEVFDTGLAEGLSYIYVDMPPQITREDGSPVVLNRQQAANRRPWALHIKPQQVLGWRSETIDGAEVLTQFRFMETVSEPDGAYSEKNIEQIRVLIREGGAVRWETHRRIDGDAKWSLYEQGTITISEIPVACFYTIRTGFFRAKPPLSDLAEVNLAHWQSQSDQKNILHVARVPILFGSGIDQSKDELAIGVSHMITASDPAAKLTYVEHSGAAISSGRDDLKDLEFQMQTLGLELLIEGAKTATGEVRDLEKATSPLAMYAESLKDALENMFRFMALFMGEKDAGSIIVNKDFGVSMRDSQDIPYILNAVTAGLISKETAIAELKRRGFLADSIEAEDEFIRVINEGYTPDHSEEFGSGPEGPSRIGRDSPQQSVG